MRKCPRSTLFLLACLVALPASAQDSVPYRVTVKELPKQPAPGLQSFAIAVHEGKWLLIGGRTSGFHRTTLPESTFPSKYSNEYIHVIDPARNLAWKVGLPDKYKLRLRATNMEFYQDGKVLYFIGGYGSTTDDDAEGDYQTFPNLTAIRVPELITAIISGKADNVEDYIVSITDDRMRVTGGGLQKLGENFYLVFGQNYNKKYKGAVSGIYTCEVRRFQIQFNGPNLAIANYEAIKDPRGDSPDSQYHRRDLNVIQAIRPDGRLGITVYGGVFTKVGLTWRNPVYIDPDANGKASVVVDDKFEQKMCQYDCARLLMFDPQSKTMYTTLFGGITYYYYNKDGQLEESNPDNSMPFTKAITTLVRKANGSTFEVPQSASEGLPGFLGADGAFISAEKLPPINGSEILDFSKLPAKGPMKVGYFYGGIRTTAPQVNGFNPSYANSTIYEVCVERK